MSQFHSAPGDATGDRIKKTTERVRETARAKAGEIKREAEHRAEAQKSHLAGRTEAIAGAVRSAGNDLDAQGEPLGAYAAIAGDKISELSRYVDDRSTGELIAEIETIARRQPWMFLGGAFAVGVVAGRFLKAGDLRTVPRDDYALDSEPDYALAGRFEMPRGDGDGW